MEPDARAMIMELRACGWESFPAGTWATVVGGLERRAEAAEAALAKAEAALADLRERAARVAPAVAQLGQLAGEELPRVAREAGELMAENGELRIRVGRSEADAELLTHALIGAEIDSLERGEHDDDDDEVT